MERTPTLKKCKFHNNEQLEKATSIKKSKPYNKERADIYPMLIQSAILLLYLIGEIKISYAKMISPVTKVESLSSSRS